MAVLDQVSSELARRGLTVSTAESCTGGLVGHLLTNVPGSSAYFLGGIVAYSNQAKMEQLRVPPEILERHGAVSDECARAMASGCRQVFRSDLAVSVTGVAGPDGGTPEKPVGLVFVALADARGSVCRRFLWGGDRVTNKQESAQAALGMLAQRLLKE